MIDRCPTRALFNASAVLASTIAPILSSIGTRQAPSPILGGSAILASTERFHRNAMWRDLDGGSKLSIGRVLYGFDKGQDLLGYSRFSGTLWANVLLIMASHALKSFGACENCASPENRIGCLAHPGT